MDMLFAVIIWCLFGLVAGAIAQLLVPGDQPLNILATIGLGVVGSLVGGFIGYVFVGGEPIQLSGMLLSILGAVIVLVIYTNSFGRARA